MLGHVADEGELVQPEIREADGRLIVAATTDVADLAAALDTELPQGDFHTVGGLVIDVAGRIPQMGESVSIAGRTFVVVSGSNRRLRTLEVI